MGEITGALVGGEMVTTLLTMALLTEVTTTGGAPVEVTAVASVDVNVAAEKLLVEFCTLLIRVEVEMDG